MAYGRKIGIPEGLSGSMRRFLSVAMVVSVALGAACSSEPTREEALEELESAGFTGETAECLLADLERQGFTTSDLTGDIGDDVQDGIEIAVQACVSTDDLVGSEEIRGEFLQGLVDSGQFTQEQAECVIAQLEGAGVPLSGMEDGGEFQAQMEAAVGACL